MDKIQSISKTDNEKRKPIWSFRSRDTFRNYAVLVIIAIVLITPFYWMISTALKTQAQLFEVPPIWVPWPLAFENFVRVFEEVPFALFIRNSLILVFFNVIGQVFACTMVAYGFSRFRFPGRSALFLILLGTLMVPTTITLVPRYIMFAKMNMINTYWPLILPAFGGNAYLIFLMRQYMMTIPLDLDEAAYIDGANRWQILLHIIIPISKPAIMLVIIFTTVWVWNDFMDPLIFLNDLEKFPISVGLSFFQGKRSSSWELLMAGSTMALLPPAILFFITQRYLVGGISASAIKG